MRNFHCTTNRVVTVHHSEALIVAMHVIAYEGFGCEPVDGVCTTKSDVLLKFKNLTPAEETVLQDVIQWWDNCVTKYLSEWWPNKPQGPFDAFFYSNCNTGFSMILVFGPGA